MRLLAAAIGAVLIILGVLLWQITADDAPTTAAQTDSAPPVAHAPSELHPGPAPAPVIADARPAPLMAIEVEDPDAYTGAFRVKSEGFWARVDEYPRTHLIGFVTDCYKGGEDPKAKLKLSYRLSIVNHVVEVRDVKVVDSTLKDAALEDCFVRSIQAARFDDAQMPDFESPEQDPEDLLIRIETLRPYIRKKKPARR